MNDYTIEHILPENLDLSAAWQQALGPEWERLQKEWLHTLGNLTLTGYNAEYSDRSFVEKQDMEESKRVISGAGRIDLNPMRNPTYDKS